VAYQPGEIVRFLLNRAKAVAGHDDFPRLQLAASHTAPYGQWIGRSHGPSRLRRVRLVHPELARPVRERAGGRELAFGEQTGQLAGVLRLQVA